MSMKKYLVQSFVVGILFIICNIALTLPLKTYAAYGANEFVTTWKTDNPGVSNDTSITIPTFSGETYNYSVDWNNDGTLDETGLTGDVTHDFGVAGTYTIRITGTFPRIFFNGGGDAPKLISVDQWGTNAWTSMESAFAGCSNLAISASDTPNLSGVTSMSGMFSGAANINQSLNDWDVSHVTDMSSLFEGASSFNQSLNSWDVSHVTDMGSMFSGASNFNGAISSWNTSSVVSMNKMFHDATVFNGDITNWNTVNVTNMASMFEGATVFNQNIGNWNTASLKKFYTMFYDAIVFNQNIGNWNITGVTDFSEVFNGGLSTKVYDLILKGWSAQSVKDSPNFDAGPTQYCNQAAHNILTNTFNWNIHDGGLANCHTLAYIAGSGGLITGVTTQYIADGENADQVTAVPTSGYTFLKWSDNSTQNPRTDLNITSSKTITAEFQSNVSSGGSSGVHFVCKDPKASNYEAYGANKQELCSYNTLQNQVAKYHFSRVLKSGMKGDDVVVLQNFLKILPVKSKVFGDKTKKAVIEFQKSHGLKPDGVVGKKTGEIIESML